MGLAKHKFELLTYVWCEGFCSYVFDKHDKPFEFDSIEEAIEELQDDFDIWAREIEDGDREPDCGYDANEFMVKCVETDSHCTVELSDGKLHLVSLERGNVIPSHQYVRINRTGLF